MRKNLGFVLLLLAGLLPLGCAILRAPKAPRHPSPTAPAWQRELKAGDILHLPTNLKMDEAGMLAMIYPARLLCVGETHDNVQAHRVQLAIIKALNERFPGQIAIGMEMFREPVQDVLDRWTAGELTELEFLKRSQWHANWTLDFRYYRAILEFARDHSLDLVALNPPRELQREISRAGLENLPEDVRKTLPEIDVTDVYHRALSEAVYGAHAKAAGGFDSFYRVQVLWEETMAANVVRYLRSPRGEGKKIVVLAGAGHLRYGFGIPKRVVRRMPLPYFIILPNEVSVPTEKMDRIMEYQVPGIPLLPADFLWMVEYEDLKSDSVRLGVQISEDDGVVKVAEVSPGSIVERAGIRVEDVILKLDDHPIQESFDLIYHLGNKSVGDRATVTIQRGGAEIVIDLAF